MDSRLLCCIYILCFIVCVPSFHSHSLPSTDALVKQTEQSPSPSPSPSPSSSPLSKSNAHLTIAIVFGFAAFVVLLAMVAIHIVVKKRRRMSLSSQLHASHNADHLQDQPNAMYLTSSSVRRSRVPSQYQHHFNQNNLLPPAIVRIQRHATSAGLSLQEIDAVAPITSFHSSQLQTCSSAPSPPVPEDDRACPICLDDMEPTSKTRRLPCNHVFHADCIEEWVTKANRCPVCNVNVIDHVQLQKVRTAAYQGLPTPPLRPAAASQNNSANGGNEPSSETNRTRRRRTRGENGVFQLEEVSNGALNPNGQSRANATSATRSQSTHTNDSEAHSHSHSQLSGSLLRFDSHSHAPNPHSQLHLGPVVGIDGLSSPSTHVPIRTDSN